MASTIHLIAHMEAGDRSQWRGDQDERPLSDLGRRQASAFATALALEQIDALYAGTALRCRQSLEPLVERLGMKVTVLPELGEKRAWRHPDGWPAGGTEAAFAAGTLLRAIEEIRARHPEGTVAGCSHGHTIPALVAYLVAAHGLPPVLPTTRRGQWYALRFEDGNVAIERREAPDFPG